MDFTPILNELSLEISKILKKYNIYNGDLNWIFEQVKANIVGLAKVQVFEEKANGFDEKQLKEINNSISSPQKILDETLNNVKSSFSNEDGKIVSEVEGKNKEGKPSKTKVVISIDGIELTVPIIK